MVETGLLPTSMAHTVRIAAVLGSTADDTYSGVASDIGG